MDLGQTKGWQDHGRPEHNYQRRGSPPDYLNHQIGHWVHHMEKCLHQPSSASRADH
jgi:hypothetical protein